MKKKEIVKENFQTTKNTMMKKKKKDILKELRSRDQTTQEVKQQYIHMIVYFRISAATVFVGNLSYDVNRITLTHLIRSSGLEPTAVRIIRNDVGNSRGLEQQRINTCTVLYFSLYTVCEGLGTWISAPTKMVQRLATNLMVLCTVAVL